MEEIHKELIDLAVRSGRAFQSAETGFIHYFHGKKEAPHQAVPLLENALFALALCRTRTAEGVQEGKALFEKLFAYQLQDGLFPSYLHDFPKAHDQFIGAHLLPVFVTLYSTFHTVLGKDFSAKLKEVIAKLALASLDLEEMPLPLRLKAAGSILKARHFCGLPEVSLDVTPLFESPSRFIPSHLADCLTGLLLGESKDAASLLQWMSNLWNPHLKVYAGPFEKMHFIQGSQEITLYDFYMSAKEGHLSKRLQGISPTHLQGALLSLLPEVQESGVGSSISSVSPYREQRGLYPFAFQWGTEDAIRSFVLFVPKAKRVDFDGKNLIEIELEELPNLDAKEEARELTWFLSEYEGLKIGINGSRASTFRSGDLIEIEDGSMKLALKIFANEGIFQGHISKGVFPTELASYGNHRFDAYNWQIFFRTIARKSPCILQIHFEHVP